MRIDGKALANKWQQEIKKDVEQLLLKPRLGIILVGDDEGSSIYVRQKLTTAVKVGIDAKLLKFESSDSEEAILEEINKRIKDFDGLIVQLPLPKHLDRKKILDSIPLAKDVDALSTKSQLALEKGEEIFIPATVRGILKIIDEQNLKINKLKVTIVGAGLLVGKPLAKKLENIGAKVDLLDISTQDLTKFTKKADLVVTATGHPGLIDARHVAPGQVVIDAGFKVVNGRPKGDVKTEEVESVVKSIAAVPGGVGPMTVMALLNNVLDAAKRR